MAVELCMDNSGWATSPRISFSYDLTQSDGGGIPMERSRSDSFLLDPSPDFDFFITGRSEPESTSADELFSDGKIIPLQFKKSAASSNPEVGIQRHKSTSLPPSPLPPSPQRPPIPKDQKKESLREIMAVADAEEKSTASKPFWRFKRSSSLNVGNTHKTSSIWSLPLLSRSKSTGSTDQNPNRAVSKDTQKPLQKPSPNLNSNPRSSSLKRPPMKKNGSFGRTQYGSYGNSIRINPVLNVPPPYISKGTTTLFGFGYFFCNGKDGKNKKKPFSPVNAQ
ncbi:uncharacterized protein LOC131237632 [Magnolia sinica]|uniref:uncharacterized protein LOC131237632 n=1 Tax=Magnolia sinica TaxID=86752 RepID=UPI002659C000|nr:uncharacterized protein LOC131237632 [Magnolia sinica]